MITAKQSGLGRGLGALIPPKPVATPAPVAAPVKEVVERPAVAQTVTKAPPRPLGPPLSTSRQDSVREVNVSEIKTNPRQPRRHFDHELMDELVQSIKVHGLLQPLLVSRAAQGFTLIAGERRLRAATLSGLKMVPVVIREASDRDFLELALIENIQRQDLNPIEEAEAYQALQVQFSLAQEEIAKKVGKSRSQVANTIRLLQLPEAMRNALMDGRLTPSHGRLLLGTENDKEREALFRAMLAHRYTTREAEEKVARARFRRPLDPNLRAAEDDIRRVYQCRVKIARDPKGKGEIRLRFTSDEELAALIDRLKEVE